MNLSTMHMKIVYKSVNLHRYPKKINYVLIVAYIFFVKSFIINISIYFFMSSLSLFYFASYHWLLTVHLMHLSLSLHT